MKKYLLFLAALAVPTLVFTSCDNDNGGDDEPVYETVYLVEKVEGVEGNAFTYTFTYNTNHTLATATSYNDGAEYRKETFNYDNEGKLIKVVSSKDGNQFDKTIEYGNNTITVIDTESGNIVFTLNSNGDIISGYAIANAADPKVEVKTTYGYDNASKLTSYTSNYYIDDVIQPAFAISTTYKYDNKNSIVYKNMLPLWYFRAYEICGKKYYIVNNVTESEDLEGRTGKTNYTYTYNDENYPVEFYTQNLTGEPLPMTTFKVTYKTVQVEVKK